MIDLHSHILPGIDDGAKDEDMALEMLKIAVNDGITDIILTPHYIHGSIDNTADFIEERRQSLCDLIAEHEININIYPGNEIFICPEIPALLDEGKLCTLNGSRYLLIELPMSIVPEYTEEILYQVRLRGYIPIIAHPERNVIIGKNHDILKHFVEQGALAQVNSTSITGLYGKKIRKTALSLIGKGLVHFISSDAHTCRGRSPKLNNAYNMISARFGEKKAEALFNINGLNVVNNVEVETWKIKDGLKFWDIWMAFFRKMSLQRFL